MALVMSLACVLLLPPPQHYDKYVVSLEVIHAPARAEMFPHFKYAVANRFYVTKTAPHGLVKATAQA